MLRFAIKDKGTAAMFTHAIALGSSPRDLVIPAGRAVRNALVAHYRENQRLPVKHEGAKRNYWLEVMRSVQTPVESDGGRAVTVSITHPTIRQKLLGGTITAKRSKFLTIPVSAEAYEAGRAGTFEHESGEKLIAMMHGERGVLATVAKDGAVDVHYVLTRSVNQLPEPRALPPLADLSKAAMDAMRARLARLVERMKGK